MRVWNFGTGQADGAWQDPLPTGRWVSAGLSCAETSHACCSIFIAERRQVLRVPSREAECTEKPAHGFFQTPLPLFSLMIGRCILLQWLLINLSHEHVHMQSPATPSKNSPGVGVVLGSQNHSRLLEQPTLVGPWAPATCGLLASTHTQPLWVCPSLRLHSNQ